MCICAAISSSFSLKAYGICLCHKFLYAYFEAVEACLAFNYGEFAIIKIGIVHILPNSYVFQSVAVA